jgi:hypothetical protein
MYSLFGPDRNVPAGLGLPSHKVHTDSVTGATTITVQQQSAQWLLEHHPILGPVAATRVTVRTTNSPAVHLDQDIAAGSSGASSVRVLRPGTGFVSGPVSVCPKARGKQHRRNGGHGLTAVVDAADAAGGARSLMVAQPGGRFRVGDELEVTQGDGGKGCTAVLTAVLPGTRPVHKNSCAEGRLITPQNTNLEMLAKCPPPRVASTVELRCSCPR